MSKTLPPRDEHAEQVVIFGWAEMQQNLCPELELLHAIPNGGKLPYVKSQLANGKTKNWSPQRAKLVQEGLKKGVPDMCLPVARRGYHGLYIELKAPGGKLSEYQQQWLDRLAEQDFLAVVCWGADEAIDCIREYLGIE